MDFFVYNIFSMVYIYDIYIYSIIYIFYTFYIDLHQLPSKPIRGSSLARQTFAVILATGGEPKVPQLKDATKAMSLEVTFQKDSGRSWGLGVQGGLGEGKHPVWKNESYRLFEPVGWDVCFFGLSGLIGVFLFLLNWDAVRFGFGGSAKYCVFLLNDGSGRQQMTFSLLNCHPSSWPLVSLSIMDQPKWMIQKLWISYNQNFAVDLVPWFQSAARCHIWQTSRTWVH